MLVNCVICSDLFSPSDDVSITPCGHLFHFVCVTQWLERSKSCPQCRAKATDKTIHRVYFNVSNTSNEVEDARSMENKIDSLTFDLRLKCTDLKNLRAESAILNSQTRGLKEEIKKLELKLSSQNNIACALLEQVSFFRGESKNSERLKQELKRTKNELESLENVKTIVHGTKEDVEDMMRNYCVSAESIQSLSSYVVILKREIKSIQAKRKANRNELEQMEQQLKLVKAEKDQFRMQVNKLETINTQLEEDLKHSEDKISSLEMKKAVYERALEESIKDDRLGRYINESPAPNEMKRPRLSNPADDMFTPLPPKSTDLVKTDIQPSPHLRLKSSSIGLTPLLAGSFRLNGSNKMSIFRNSRMAGTLSSNSAYYDGLGGHSKHDSFPMPKKTNVFKNVKPHSTFTKAKNNQLPPQSLRLESYFDLAKSTSK